MYWMVGWRLGGWAGTLFCRGTEMSINLRAMAFSSLDIVLTACFCEPLFRSAQRCRRACAPAKNTEIARQGLPHESEKTDSVMVNRAFHSHQHLDFEPE